MEICDIWGSEYPPTAHYCGRCGVDLTDKTESINQLIPRRHQNHRKRRILLKILNQMKT